MALAREVADMRYVARRLRPKRRFLPSLTKRLGRRMPRALRRRQAVEEFLRVTRTTFGE